MGFETTLNVSASRKELKYRPLLTDLANDYKHIKFINLSISSLGISFAWKEALAVVI